MPEWMEDLGMAMFMVGTFAWIWTLVFRIQDLENRDA